MEPRNVKHVWAIPVIVVIFLMLAACQLFSKKATPVPIGNVPQPQMAQKNNEPPAPTQVAPPEKKQVATAQAPAAEPGVSRKNPIPIGTQISVAGWDIKVMEFLRGDAALKVINSGDWKAKPLPDGQEYALAKVFLRCTVMDNNPHSLGISEMSMTGSRNLTYGDTIDGWPAPEFLFEDMFTADVVEGWIDAVIPKDENNLMIVLDINQDKLRFVRYFALEEGASLSLPPEFAGIQFNDLGVAPDKPAPRGQAAITPEWEITVTNVLKRQDAEAMLKKNAQQFEPNAKNDYYLIQVNVRYFNPNDVPGYVGGDTFYPVDVKGMNNEGTREYYFGDPPDQVWIAQRFLPGSSGSGWVILMTPKGSGTPVIAFDPNRWDYGAQNPNLRFLSIE